MCSKNERFTLIFCLPLRKEKRGDRCTVSFPLLLLSLHRDPKLSSFTQVTKKGAVLLTIPNPTDAKSTLGSHSSRLCPCRHPCLRIPSALAELYQVNCDCSDHWLPSRLLLLSKLLWCERDSTIATAGSLQKVLALRISAGHDTLLHAAMDYTWEIH